MKAEGHISQHAAHSSAVKGEVPLFMRLSYAGKPHGFLFGYKGR